MADKPFKPTSTDPIMGDIYEHPSFGTMNIYRSHGSHRNTLFGSSIKHNTTIHITINAAELHRNLNKDWISERKRIVEIEMSPTQFADAITSFNQSGVPVTLRWIKGIGNIEEPPYQSKVEQFNDEFDQHVKTVAARLDEVIELAKETKAQKRLLHALEMAKQEIGNNMPFVNEQFSRQMDHTVKEAKGEVEGFVQNLIQNYGIEAIRNQAPVIGEQLQLTDKDKPSKEVK